MNLLYVVVLAIVQGLTEFLPISSSGHLVILSAMLSSIAPVNESSMLMLEVVLHIGTLLAVLVVFWRRIWRLLGEDRRVVLTLIVATLPAAVVWLAVKKLFPHYYSALASDALLAGAMLLATGVLLLLCGRWPGGQLRYQELSLRQALIIGLAQALSPLPGISRSGWTIIAGLALGLRRDAAATFSFLLAIPAISGTAVLELLDPVAHSQPGLEATPLVIGVAVSFLVGLASLRWLLKWLEQGRLNRFAWWCIPLGCGVVAWQLVSG